MLPSKIAIGHAPTTMGGAIFNLRKAHKVSPSVIPQSLAKLAND